MRMVVENSAGPLPFTLDTARHTMTESLSVTIQGISLPCALPGREVAETLVQSYFTNVRYDYLNHSMSANQCQDSRNFGSLRSSVAPDVHRCLLHSSELYQFHQSLLDLLGSSYWSTAAATSHGSTYR